MSLGYISLAFVSHICAELSVNILPMLVINTDLAISRCALTMLLKLDYAY